MAKLIQFVKFKNKIKLKKKFTTFRLPKELNDKEDANYCFLYLMSNLVGRWLSGKESACQCRRRKRHRFDPWVGKIPSSRKWQPTPIFLPGKIPWTEEPDKSTVHRVTKSQNVLECKHAYKCFT